LSIAIREKFVGIAFTAAVLAWLASALPAGAQPGPPPDCDEHSNPAERNACIEARLQAARAENQSVRARCQGLVAPALRDDFVASHESFQSLLPVRCDSQATGVDDESMQTFVRSRCLVKALSDNTQGMLAAHPECRPPN
jgi:hypothetical protein